MAHHHLLPFLALILLILPSSSQAQTQATTALFSDDGDFLVSGHNLTQGVYTLSLKPDCGLTFYNNTKGTPEVVDFKTPTDDSGCELRINKFGQLNISYSEGFKEHTILGEAGEEGTYALLFTDSGPAIFGPRAYTKNSTGDRITSTPKKLKQSTSSNFMMSPEIINYKANGEAFASNQNVLAYITSSCTLLVKNLGKPLWHTEPATDKPTECTLYLTSRGVLSLISKDSKGLQTHWTGGDLKDVNSYVAALRHYGALDIYGLKINVREIPPYSGSVAGNIRMVTA